MASVVSMVAGAKVPTAEVWERNDLDIFDSDLVGQKWGKY